MNHVSRTPVDTHAVTGPARTLRPPVPAAGSLHRRWSALLRDDDGMSTVEYAIGTVAAAAFAAILYAVVSGDSIVGALTGIVQRALAPTF